jgi:hypothetical protein
MLDNNYEFDPRMDDDLKKEAKRRKEDLAVNYFL